MTRAERIRLERVLEQKISFSENTREVGHVIQSLDHMIARAKPTIRLNDTSLFSEQEAQNARLYAELCTAKVNFLTAAVQLCDALDGKHICTRPCDKATGPTVRNMTDGCSFDD